MRCSLLALFILFLSPLTLAETVIACLDFNGFVGTPNSSGSYTVTAAFRSATDPSNAATLQEVCSNNEVFQTVEGGLTLTCIPGYTGIFFWELTVLTLFVYTTPKIPPFEDADNAFSLTKSVLTDGATYSGRFGCDGQPHTVTEWF